MIRGIWRAAGFSLALFTLLAVSAGCQALQPQPTPSPAEAAATAGAEAEELAAEYPLAATAWDLDFLGSPEESLALIPDSRASLFLFWDRYAGFDGC